MLFFNRDQLFKRDAGDNAGGDAGDDAGDGVDFDVSEIAAEAGLPAEVAELIDDTSEEGARRQAKLAAAILEHAKKSVSSDDTKRQPAKNAGGFDGDKLDKLLDNLSSKFGEEAINQRLAERLGVDKIAERQAALELREARSEIAERYGLSKKEVAGLPGSTPEELERAAKYVVSMLETRGTKGDAGSAKRAGSLIPQRTQSGKRSAKSVEEALEAFNHGYTAADDISATTGG